MFQGATDYSTEIKKNLSPLPARSDKRFAKPGEKTSWQVTECWDLHHEIKRRIFIGQKNTVIALELGCDKQTVSLVRNSDVVKAELAEMHKAADTNVVDITKEIAAKQSDALRVLADLMMDSTSDQVRAGCAKDLLDRGGNAAVKSVNVTSTNFHLTGEDILGIKERSQQAALAAGLITETQVIDITPNQNEANNLDD